MQSATAPSRGLFDIFTDNLDTFLGAAIKDRFNEGGGEQPEGATEFANPSTVTQPVHPAQLPGGQSLNRVATQLGLPPAVIIGGVSVLVFALVLFLIRRT